MVKGRVWGKATPARPELHEKGSKGTNHMAGYTYELHRGKRNRGVGGRRNVVRGRARERQGGPSCKRWKAKA